jgi:hypothetical protein
MKIIFKYLLIFLIIIPIYSCKEKDDKDFIIGILNKAKQGDIDDIKEYLTFDLTQKDILYDQAEFLIEEMKNAEIPDKDSIKNIINNGEYQTYKIKLEPSHTLFMIGLTRDKKNIKINDLFRIKSIEAIRNGR